MDQIIGTRQSGRTHTLLKMAHDTDKVIVCNLSAGAMRLMEYAKVKGFNIKNPIGAKEFMLIQKDINRNKKTEYLIDDIEHFLGIITGCNVSTFTFNGNIALVQSPNESPKTLADYKYDGDMKPITQLIGARQSGRTYELLKMAHDTDKVIVSLYNTQAHWLIGQANKGKFNVKRSISAEAFMSIQNDPNRNRKTEYLIDDIQYFLDIVSDCNVTAFTFNGDIKLVQHPNDTPMIINDFKYDGDGKPERAIGADILGAWVDNTK